MEKTPLVSVCCITYNHAPYISQCVDGFLMQKTSFPFEIIINDDCSNDGTTEILKDYAIKYPDLIHLILHDENQYSKGIRRILATFVYPLVKGKYIAICEGDDYWTDPYKLQKQVDYLESHPECGLIYTDFDMFYQNNNCFENDLIKSGHYPQISSFEEHLQKAAYIAPPSWLYRRESKAYVENQMNKGFVDGSFSLALEFFKHSKVHFLEDTTCVYRVLPESASHHKSMLKQYIYAKGVYNEQIYFCHKYNVEKEISDAIKARFYRKYYGQTLSYGERKEKHELIEVSKSFMNEGLKNRLIRGLLSTKLSISLFSLVCRCKYRKD